MYVCMYATLLNYELLKKKNMNYLLLENANYFVTIDKFLKIRNKNDENR